jgi:hypothetical protein
MTNEQAAIETEIQKVTGGALMPDATSHLENVMLALLMTPMKDPRSDSCPMGMPGILWGLSGIGKSAIIKQAAAKLGLHVEVVYPGTHAPEDFSSLPVVLADKLMSACMLTQVTILNDMGGGLLFLDEVSCAAPAVQGAMLSMVLDRRVGAVRFHPNIRILMAANPPEYSAGGWGLEAPFANRSAHFYVGKPPVDKLINWILSEGSQAVRPLNAPTARLKEEWSGVWPQIKGSWVGFVRGHDSIRNQQPKPDNAQAGYCWPSDRSWEFAFRCMATVRCLGLESNLENLMMEACVGEGAAAEYLAWAIEADLPDPRVVLAGGWSIPRQLDRVHATYASITSLVIGLPEGQERMQLATQAWLRLADLGNVGHWDIVATHASALITDGLGPYDNPVSPDLKKAAEAVILETGRKKNLTAQWAT